MVGRFQRTIKTAIKARDSTNWTGQLPSVMLGLRAAFREDLHGSIAQMVFGEQLRIPGEFIEPIQEPERS